MHVEEKYLKLFLCVISFFAALILIFAINSFIYEHNIILVIYNIVKFLRLKLFLSVFIRELTDARQIMPKQRFQTKDLLCLNNEETRFAGSKKI